jgi:methionyl-tRNA formyltransferase
MRIILVMSEASLWKPEFVQGFIEKMPNSWNVVAAVLTNFRPRNASMIKHIKRYAAMPGLRAFMLISAREIYQTIADITDRIITLPKPHSIAGVCRRHKIPTLISKDVNSPETIDWIKKFNPDVLLSSGNQIFRKELLNVAKIASLNRHTSLLPAYGGIYPIFWCLLNNEKQVGVSVHTMTEKIDEGVVISQTSLPINTKDTFFSLFEKCFQLSADVAISAIQKVEKGDLEPVVSGLEKSYYSYPTLNDVRRFRKMAKKML